MWALGFLRDQKAVEPLLRLWDKGLLRTDVALALGFQRDTRALRQIMAACEDCLATAQTNGNWDEQESLMRACVVALGQLRDPAAVALLKKMLEAGPQRTKAGNTYLVADESAQALLSFGFRVAGDRTKGGYRIVAEPTE